MVGTDRFFGPKGFGESGEIASTASIFIDGGARQITLPKKLRAALKASGWTNGPVIIIWNDAEPCLRIYPMKEVQKKLREAPAIEVQKKKKEMPQA
ncbi:MAG: MraZ N-terminal domain-containing protein [Candidatus Micrarchaeota archaeon]